jgi:hypothetical protein
MGFSQPLTLPMLHELWVHADKFEQSSPLNGLMTPVLPRLHQLHVSGMLSSDQASIVLLDRIHRYRQQIFPEVLLTIVNELELAPVAS